MSGFPGESFEADVHYVRLEEDRLQLAIEIDGIEGPHRAELRLHYGVPVTFSTPDQMPTHRAPALSSSMRLEAAATGRWVSHLALSPDFPHLAFELSLRQVSGDRLHCEERYFARVLSGSVPPRGDGGQLVRFHPLDAH
ncbi:MAG: hypothetical protein AAF184_09165 [Pseudomonadota bacterium]